MSLPDNTDTKIADHLYAIWSTADMDRSEFEYRSRAIKALFTAQADHLLAEVEALIGNDETEYSNLDGDAGYWEKHGRNDFREKLRQGINKIRESL